MSEHHCVGRAALLVLGVLAGLGGCTLGPDYAAPATGTPALYHEVEAPATLPPGASGTTASPADIATWWDGLHDDALAGLITRALANNLDVAQAEARIRQARASRDITEAGLLPQLNASGSATRSRSSSGRGLQRRASTGNFFRAGFDASWEIDVFGGVRRSVEAGDATIVSRVEDRNDVWVSLAAEVATDYAALRGSQEQLDIARRNLKAQQDTLDLTAQRLSAGYVSALDEANARSQVATTQSQIPSYEATARANAYAIGVLLGETPESVLSELEASRPLPSVPPTIAVGLPSELLERRPDIRRASSDLHAATARIGAATADLFPKFSLTGSLGAQGTEFGQLGTIADRYWSFGPSISWPVFQGGQIVANIELQKAATDEALALYKSTVLAALRDVETALSNFSREQVREAALVDAVKANREAVDYSTQLYRAGKTDFLNVLNAQRQLLGSEASLSQSRTAVVTNLISLYKALGGGWTPENQQPDVYKNTPNPASAGPGGS